MSVKVAVRVRPFNSREKALNCKLCVDMQGTTTIIEDEEGKTRPFTFDYSFWSHDEFIEDPDGYMRPAGDRYADQQKVYKAVGEEVLRNAWDGYHCTLFAYGQTGSGKSYSMIGYGANKGIVPISSEEIFTRIDANKDTSVSFEVSVSMIEIYNEKIQDLLIDPNDRVKGGLKVRESKTLGVYVEGLTTYNIKSYAEIAAKMDEGSRNRSIGATEMNAHSSRAHTIIMINFMQKKTTPEGRTTEKISVINLVDLAGSEKASKTGAQGDRLKEGCSINKSLTVLGIVISTLAEKAGGKAKGKVVPFRDSALTRILQNALGGNSKTLMICAVSPASNNYEETLSTLRYADQAKKIKCNAVINESETDKIIRELKEENERFKKHLMELAKKGLMPKDFDISALLGSYDGETNKELEEEDERALEEIKENQSSTQPSTQGSAPLDEETVKHNEELKNKLAQTEEQLRAHMMMMEEYERTFKEGIKEKKNPLTEKEKFDVNFPHLSNVNEDPMLTGKVIHSFKDQPVIKVGRKNCVGPNDIKLSAMGILPEHAILEIETEEGEEGGAVYLSPASEDVKTGLYLNGERVEQKERLYHLDRIIFGTSTIFLFKDYPNAEFKRTELEERDIDLEFCQTEMSQKTQQVDDLVKNVEEDFVQAAKVEETERQLKEQEEAITQYKMKLENIEMDSQRIEKEIEFKQMQADFEKKKLERDIEVERHKQMLKEKQLNENKIEKEKKLLDQNLARNMPLIVETNLIARELKRDISFNPYLSYQFSDVHDLQEEAKDENSKMLILKVKVENHEEGYFYMWDMEKFLSRYFMIRELLDDYFGTNELPELSKEEDPFWDPPEPQLVGQGFLKLLSIAYLLDSPTELILVGDSGQTGVLNVSAVANLGQPCSRK
jgi:kinesin family protein 13